jgi:hypothetical protein
MPLLARHRDVGTVDATVPGQFAAVHLIRPSLLTCRECGWKLNAVRSHLGTPFFRHAPRAPRCSTAGESAEHLRLKQLLREVAAAAGWDARMEDPVPPRWADVLATRPDHGRRIALEVQLARQSAVDTAARTADYAAADVETIWVVVDPFRLGDPVGVPRLELDETDRVCRPLARLATRTVDHHDGRRNHELSEPYWRPADSPADLTATIAAIFDRRVVWHSATNAWVPAADLARHRAQHLAYEQTAALFADERLEHEAEVRAAADQVAARLEQHGHGVARIAIGHDRRWAHAALVTTPSDLVVVVAPDPAAVTTPRTLDSHKVVAPDHLCASLHEVGVRHAEALTTWKPPTLPLIRPDGRFAGKGALDLASRIERIAVALDLTLDGPRWDEATATWQWTVPAGHRLAVVPARDHPEDPTAVPTGPGWAIYVRTRDAPDHPQSVIAKDLTGRHLSSTKPPEPKVDPAPPVQREPRPLAAALDEVRRRLPRGRALGSKLIDPSRPELGYVLGCHEGVPIVITHDPTTAGTLPPGAVVYIPDADAPHGLSGHTATGDPTVAASLAAGRPE